MTAVNTLRIAAAAAAIQGAAHGAMVLRYTPVHGAAEAAVVAAMQSNHFLFAGALRSYWDFYTGYAMMSAFTCAIEALMLWRLAAYVRTSGDVVRSVAAVFVLFNAGHAVLAAHFFFVLPVTFDLLLIALIGASFPGYLSQVWRKGAISSSRVA